MADSQTATREKDVVSGDSKADGRVKGIPMADSLPTTRTEPEAPHGTGPRGLLATPSSPSTAGRFGRMFRRLPVFTCNPDSMIVLGAAMVQQPEDGFIDKQLGVDDDDENVSRLSNGELRLPAGYTYFGQFVDHDITFDPVSSLTRQNDPDSLTDFRTPKFDLDSLYGRGPADGVIADILNPTSFRTAGGKRDVIRPHLLFYDWIERPFMPVEFAVAAYRFGHSAIRPSYHINSKLQNGPFSREHDIPQTGAKAFRIPIFTDTPTATDSLGGFQAIPKDWGVDWNFFLHLGAKKQDLPQPSYKIDTSIANPLGLMPDRVTGPESLDAAISAKVAKAIPVRNLVRHRRL